MSETPRQSLISYCTHNRCTSVRRRGKNVDSSSKSNPLRRRGKNYDASTWERRRRRQKWRKSANF